MLQQGMSHAKGLHQVRLRTNFLILEKSVCFICSQKMNCCTCKQYPTQLVMKNTILVGNFQGLHLIRIGYHGSKFPFPNVLQQSLDPTFFCIGLLQPISCSQNTIDFSHQRFCETPPANIVIWPATQNPLNPLFSEITQREKPVCHGNPSLLVRGLQLSMQALHHL